MPNASMHHVVNLTDISLRAAKRCCVAGATEAAEGACFDAELHLHFDQICVRASEPSGTSAALLHCCTLDQVEARDRCLAGLPRSHDGDLEVAGVGAGSKPPPPQAPPEFKGDICKEHAEENARLYDWLVWEFSLRYPLTSLSLPVMLAGGYITGVTTCCLVEQEHTACLAALDEEFKNKVAHKIFKAKKQCQLLKSMEKHDFQDMILVVVSQQSPSLSVDESKRIALRVENSTRNCCLKHADGFCLYTKSAIHDEICLDKGILSHHPRLAQCCRSLGSPRLRCSQGVTEKFHSILDTSSLLSLEEQCRFSHDQPEEMHD
uniref:Serum albumin SDS-1-like n=1 Tax=Petromyzon marinus TaxID=7757 RepID=A0AAJ7SL15_PETMA